MYQQLLCQIFSEQCQLTFLQLDISKSSYDIHRCLTVSDGFQSYCITLHHLQIHLGYACFLEDLIEHVPNLEQLSVQLQRLERYCRFQYPDIQSSMLPNVNWFNKVNILRDSIPTCISTNNNSL
jgi:hypothetical protein